MTGPTYVGESVPAAELIRAQGDVGAPRVTFGRSGCSVKAPCG